MKKKLKNIFKKFKSTFSKNSNTLFNDKELIYFCWITNIFQEAMKVPGHIIEIGVASGRNSLLFGSLLKLTGESNHRKYYGFDTFEGYAEDTISDNPWLSSDSWKNEDCTLRNVKKRIQKADLSETCAFFKGDCRKTIPEFLSSHKDNRIQAGQAVISLLYIDCNGYLPAISSIEKVYPYIAPGGIICIDEKIQGGETKALLEFARANNLIAKHSYYGVPAYLQKN